MKDLGLDQWIVDTVSAEGLTRPYVKGGRELKNDVGPSEEVSLLACRNEAQLNFNYQVDNGAKPLEFEILDYKRGLNWLGTIRDATVSHFGMHCQESDLLEIEAIMTKHGCKIAQDVRTVSHTNPAIKDTRRYHYVIFNTREILGTDLKFIVRRNIQPERQEEHGHSSVGDR